MRKNEKRQQKTTGFYCKNQHRPPKNLQFLLFGQVRPKFDLGKTTISRNQNAETMESVTFEQWLICGLDKNVNLDLQK